MSFFYALVFCRKKLITGSLPFFFSFENPVGLSVLMDRQQSPNKNSILQPQSSNYAFLVYLKHGQKIILNSPTQDTKCGRPVIYSGNRVIFICFPFILSGLKHVTDNCRKISGVAVLVADYGNTFEYSHVYFFNQ